MLEDLLNQHDIEETIRVATSLMVKHPNARIFGLGQSPAWIIKAVEAVSEANNVTIETGLLPFSGHLPDITKNQPALTYALFDHTLHPENEIQGYRHTLTKLGMAPEKIISLFEEEQIQTIVVDCIYSGKGVASFLYILHDWAREQHTEPLLQQALKVCGITPSYRQSSTISLLDFRSAANQSTHSKEIGYVKSQYAIDFEAMNSGLRAQFLDSPDLIRIVPSFDHTMWGGEPPSYEDDPETIGFMLEQIADEARMHVSNHKKLSCAIKQL